MKSCPFKNANCDSECGLFIKASELNEMVVNRLRAIGVITTEQDGICSLKNMALAQSRYIFENTKVFN
ncbi:MAG: hypothetical protein IJ003_03565 [Candidatus Gastranaerophilales bacterium]|nr:hypothetical protein [Candidatus Gastranaerophilales bacterium]